MIRAVAAVEMAKSNADLEVAAREFQRATELDPKLAAAWYNLGSVKSKVGQFDAAILSYKRYLALVPNAEDAQKIQDEIVKLEFRQELALEKLPFKDCDGCPEMVVVPSGSYIEMGGSRQITLSRPLAVGKTEVTFAQWDACVAEGGCMHRPDDEGWGRGNQPVMNVNWNDAKQFVAWLARKTGKSYRLLSEAEWEYSGRAGTTTQYYWGDSDSDICRYASVDKGGQGCGTHKTSPVGSRQPNAFGLYDMLGNVWEWVEDCYNKGIDGVPDDGNARTAGDCGWRMLRGGAWNHSPGLLRFANRGYNPATFRDASIGFRVARTR